MYYFLPVDRSRDIPDSGRAQLEISERQVQAAEGEHSEEVFLLIQRSSGGDFGGMNQAFCQQHENRSRGCEISCAFILTSTTLIDPPTKDLLSALMKLLEKKVGP